MTPGQLKASIERCEQTLRSLKLLSDRRAEPDYSTLLPSDVRNTPYPKLWRKCLERGWYDLRLRDESFFQFRIQDEFSFSFYESPVSAIAFEDFGFERYGEEWAEIAADLQSEYEEYVSSLSWDWPATPVRFDYSPSAYRSPGHPAAHIHFGYSSEVRIATRRLISPEAFVLFVLRQYFADSWITLFEKKPLAHLARRCRGALKLIPDSLWSQMDACEMYLE
ncbi:MAG: DUF2290 domain-containing protein [Steroidobacteraceae bacterium]